MQWVHWAARRILGGKDGMHEFSGLLGGFFGVKGGVHGFNGLLGGFGGIGGVQRAQWAAKRIPGGRRVRPGRGTLEAKRTGGRLESASRGEARLEALQKWLRPRRAEVLESKPFLARPWAWTKTVITKRTTRPEGPKRKRKKKCFHP